MQIFNPRQKLKEFSEQYPYDQRGYYYLSSYSSTLNSLMKKWTESETGKIDELYFIELQLYDFIEDDLKEVYKACGKSKSLYSEKYKRAENKLNLIKSSFLTLFDKIKNEN
jgi:hypothetical protein